MTLSSRMLTLPLLALLGNLPAIAVYCVSGSDIVVKMASAIERHNDAFAATCAGAAFSMLGFMAAMLALFALIAQSPSFIRYRKGGMLARLMTMMAITMLELAVSFVLSLHLFVDPFSPPHVIRVFIAICGCAGMLAVSVIPIFALHIRASEESVGEN